MENTTSILLEEKLGVEKGKIKQMDFLDFIEVALTEYESEALANTIKQIETAKQAAEAAVIMLQKAQADINEVNNQTAIANIARNTILDLVRRRAGCPNKQNWYNQEKGILVIDPN